MDEKRYYRAIGIFVSFGFLALFFLALRLSSGNFLYNTDQSYEVKIEFSNVGRLKPQSKIAISGVTVGRVKVIRLNPETFSADVICDIHADYKSIPDDSRVAVVTAGLLGDNYLTIYPGFSESFWHKGSVIEQSQTTPALVLEELISKVVSTLSSSKSLPTSAEIPS